MLKERILYLCNQKDITRKELTDGLVAQTHFANILAGRYSLAPDLAEVFARRLGVSCEYISEVDNWSETSARQIDSMALTILQGDASKGYVAGLPLYHNELYLELAASLTAACILFQQGRLEECTALHESYLDFYLEAIAEPDIAAYPVPVRKIIYIYKSMLARSSADYKSALIFLNNLIEIAEDQTGQWVAVQNYRAEAYINLAMYDNALEISDEILLRIRKENRLNFSATVYIMRCGIYDRIKMYQTAAVELAKAEESLMYVEEYSRGPIFSVILNNRIHIFIKMQYFDMAHAAITQLEEGLLLAGLQTEAQIRTAADIYRCMAYCGERKWKDVETTLSRLDSGDLRPDQNYIRLYSRGLLLLGTGKYEQAQTHLTDAYELGKTLAIGAGHRADLCFALGEVFEQQRKYKKSTLFYKESCKFHNEI